LIDIAEIYGNGDAERLISHVVAGQRDRVFMVSKVWPTHVAGNGIERAREASLSRLGTDHLDLYLLHWPNEITEYSNVATEFSNFKIRDMENLFHVPNGGRCAPNQVAYNLGDRVLSMTCGHGASSMT
jgi:diketogulonate reductase-like aldo/keto reductase